MRFDVTPLPAEMRARPFTADEQCALNAAMKTHWEATARPIDKIAPFNIKRVGYPHFGRMCDPRGNLGK